MLRGSPAVRTIVLINLVSVFCHLWAINTPPTGAHAWRQCHTAAAARSLYEEGMNPLQPRVDARGAGDGITGMEFPLVNWLIACTYYLFGFQHWSGRAVVLLFSLIANTYFFLIARRFFSSHTALWATLIWIFGPTYFYYARNLTPDVPALAMALGCLYFYLRSEERGYRWNGVLMTLHLGLAGLIKIPYLSIIGLILALHIYSHGFSFRHLAKPLLIILTAIVLPLAWWRYALQLQTRISYEHFGMQPVWSLDGLLALKILRKLILTGIPENLLGYSFVVFIIVFVFVHLFPGKVKLSGASSFFLLAWLLAALAQTFLQLKKIPAHDYMWLPLFPPLALAAGLGFDYALRNWRSPAYKVVIVAALLATPPVLYYQFARNLASPWVPPAFARLESICDQVLPAEARIIAAPDPTPCVMLYYAHRKGWVFGADEGLAGVRGAIQEGAHYLVSVDKDYWNRTEIRSLFPYTLYTDDELAILSDSELGEQKSHEAGCTTL